MYANLAQNQLWDYPLYSSCLSTSFVLRIEISPIPVFLLFIFLSLSPSLSHCLSLSKDNEERAVQGACQEHSVRMYLHNFFQ